jgi:hypothetical protein
MSVDPREGTIGLWNDTILRHRGKRLKSRLAQHRRWTYGEPAANIHRARDIAGTSQEPMQDEGACARNLAKNVEKKTRSATAMKRNDFSTSASAHLQDFPKDSLLAIKARAVRARSI